jgi:hypothetical protein
MAVSSLISPTIVSASTRSWIELRAREEQLLEEATDFQDLWMFVILYCKPRKTRKIETDENPLQAQGIPQLPSYYLLSYCSSCHRWAHILALIRRLSVVDSKTAGLLREMAKRLIPLRSL